jgi:hypothetical protein
MEEQPYERSSEAGDGKPKFFQSVNGMIAGATALLVALGGLATATKQFWGDKPAAPQSVAATASRSAATGQDQPAAARPVLYRGDLYSNGAFTGGSMKLEYDGRHWVLNDGTSYDYDEIVSDDKSRIMAGNAEYQSTLRWPIKGGVVEESSSLKRDDWKTYATVKPAN